MLLNNKVMYEKEYLVNIQESSDELYYFFDYDERSYAINMDFQHFHHFYEIHILLDSYANHIIEGNFYSIKFLDIVCLKPHRLHKSEYPKGPASKRLIIQFNFPPQTPILQKQTDRLLKVFEKPLPIYRFSDNEQELLSSILNELFMISKNKSSTQALLIHNKFIEFLYTLYRLSKNNLYEPEQISTSSSKIYTIASYIHEHFSDELSLESLARKFYVSTYYLSHLFKEVTGFTLIHYIQMTRVRNAQQLLLFTDKKITEIAAECGFTSFSQFNRVFNKFCSSSPRNYKTNGVLNSNTDSLSDIYVRD